MEGRTRSFVRTVALQPGQQGVAWLAVGLLAGLWSMAIGSLAIARHLSFHSGFDLGIFAQVAWSTANGRPFFTSLAGGTTNFLGEHFAPLLAVLAPLYSLWPDARTLLVVQTLALAAGAFPLFAFGRARLGARLAVVVVVAYLLSPLLHFVALFDFHEIALAVPLLMAAGAALLDERSGTTLLYLGLALMAKEEVALIAVAMGLYAWLVQKRWRFGLALTAGSIAWTALLFGWIMPAMSPSTTGYPFLNRYGALGSTLGEILQTLFTQPASVAQVVATRSKAVFILQLLVPLGGLPLLGWPAVLLVLPPLAYLLLASYEVMASIFFHYTAPLIPFLFLATVVALQRLGRWSAQWRRAGAIVLCAAALLSAWRWSPLPGGGSYDPDVFAVTEEERATRRLLETIPANAALASDWTYLPWLANRWQIDTLLAPPFRLIAPEQTPDFVLDRFPGPNAVSAPLYPWIVQPRSEGQLRVPRFAPEGTAPGGLVLWKWRGPEHDVRLARYDVPFERGLVLVAAGLAPGGVSWDSWIPAEPGTVLPIWMAWSARNRLDRRVTFSLHLVDDSGTLTAQIDQEMGAGRFPVTLWHDWLESPLVADEFRLSIPLDLAPGCYRLLAGAYDSETVVALRSVVDGEWFELAQVSIGAAPCPGP